MNDYIPHIVFGLVSVNIPTVKVIAIYWITIFILGILPRQRTFNLFHLTRFAAKDTPMQINHFIAFVLARLLGSLMKPFLKL